MYVACPCPSYFRTSIYWPVLRWAMGTIQLSSQNHQVCKNILYLCVGYLSDITSVDALAGPFEDIPINPACVNMDYEVGLITWRSLVCLRMNKWADICSLRLNFVSFSAKTAKTSRLMQISPATYWVIRRGTIYHRATGKCQNGLETSMGVPNLLINLHRLARSSHQPASFRMWQSYKWSAS